MDLPKIKKRIGNFIVREEGRISKQSLISMGAFLGSAAVGSIVSEAQNASAQHASGSPPPPPPCTVCCGNGDMDGQRDGADSCNGEPGRGCPVHKDALIGHNAYDENGTQIYFGTAECWDDSEIFHFNGTEFAYAGNTLAAEHHHHGSHNSY